MPAWVLSPRDGAPPFLIGLAEDGGVVFESDQAAPMALVCVMPEPSGALLPALVLLAVLARRRR